MNSPHFADLAKVHGEKEAYEMLASRPSHYDEAEYAKLMMDKPQGTKADEWAEANTMFAKGGDNLFAGVIAGVERDEEGNVTFDPAKFVLGLGGYTAVKAMLKNKQFQGVLKEYAERAITELETGSSQGARFGRMFTGSNHIVDPSKGMQKEMRGIYNVTFNGKNATEVRKADADAIIKYERGFENSNTGKGQGAVHIEKHLQDGSVGQVSKEELLNIGEVIRNGKLYESYGKNVYELEKNGVTLKVVTGNMKNGKERVITFYSNRNLEEGVRSSGTITSTSSKTDIIPQSQRDANLAKWHKDSHPLTKNEDGSPKVFYHGTSSKFDTFKETEINKTNGMEYGVGFYFTNRKSVARRYGNTVEEYFLKINNPFIVPNGKSLVTQVEQKIGFTKKEHSNMIKGNKYTQREIATNIIKKHGYDSVVAENEVMILNPNQIKSVHNRGAFDSTNPNTLMANPTPSLAGASLGGSDALINQRDYDGDGEFTFRDLAIGAGIGGAGVHALSRAKPEWFKNDFKDTDAVAGMFVGAKPKSKGAFSDVATKKTMREIDDSGARFVLPTKTKSKLSDDFFNYDKLDENTLTMHKELAGFKGTNQDYIKHKAKQGYSELYDITKDKYTLDEVLDHPALFEQYPELKNIKVSFHKGELQANGSFSNGEIALKIGDPKEMKSTLLHEVQHAIQTKEGWARGGNIDEFKVFDREERINKILDGAKQRGRIGENGTLEDYRQYLIKDINSPDTPEIAKRYIADEVKKIEELQNTPYQNYHRLWGEQQARATQHRADYAPEQRAGEAWSDTLAKQEGSYPEPIIKYDDGVAMSMASRDAYADKIATLSKRLEGRELTPEQKKIAEVYLGKRSVAELKTDDINTLKESLYLTKGSESKGAKHIIFKHFDEKKESLTPDELVDIVDIIRKSDVEHITATRRQYTYFDEQGTRLRVVIDEDKRNGKDFIVTYYSNRKKPVVGHNDTYPTEGASSTGFGESIPQNSTPSNPNMRGGHLEAGGAGKGLFDHDFSHLEQRVLEQSNKEFKDISQNGDAFANMRSLFREYFTDSFSGAYHRARDLTHTNMQAKDSSISRLAKVLDGLDDATNRDIYRYLTKTGGENLTGDVRELADTLRANIDALGARAVDAGVLSEKAYKEWVGEYLIRQYESKTPKTMMAGFRGFTVDRIFERGIGKEFSNAKDMVGWLNKQGYIKDGELLNFGTMKQVGEYLQANGMLGKLGEGKIELTNMLNGKVKLRRDFTKAEREAMGELESNHILNNSIYYD